MVIDLAPLVNQVVIPILAPVLMAIAAWGIKRVADFAHVSKDSQLRSVVSAAVDNGINYAIAKIGTVPTSFETKNVIAAEAAAYVLPKIPGALNGLGITPDHLTQLIVAKLPA